MDIRDIRLVIKGFLLGRGRELTEERLARLEQNLRLYQEMLDAGVEGERGPDWEKIMLFFEDGNTEFYFRDSDGEYYRMLFNDTDVLVMEDAY